MGDKYVIKAAFRWRITHTFFGWDPGLAQAKRSGSELIPIFHTGALSYDVDRSSANILGNILVQILRLWRKKKIFVMNETFSK
jgi:hypothetical protein